MPTFTIVEMLLQTNNICTKLQTVLAHVYRVYVVLLFRHGGVVPCLGQPTAEVDLVDQFLFGVLKVFFQVIRIHALVFVVFKGYNFILVYIWPFFGFVLVLCQGLFVDFLVDVYFFDGVPSVPAAV